MTSLPPPLNNMLEQVRAEHQRMGTPTQLILDTDIGPDCDDAGAVAVVHALADQGQVDVLGMFCNTTSPWGAPALQAINTYFGRPQIPVGTLKGPGNSGSLNGWNGETYNRYLAQHYPNQIQHGRWAPDAVQVYRQLLARCDGEVVVVSIGHLTNLSQLLASGPDDVSPLTGRELAQQAVAELVIMGGRYPSGWQESNFLSNPEAAQHVVGSWPTPITFIGAEIGEQIFTGQRLVRKTDSDNPVRLAYQRWDQHFCKLCEPAAILDDGIRPHASHDQLAVLYAVRGLGVHWSRVTTGHNVVLDDGSNQWQLGDSQRRHGYLAAKQSLDLLARTVEELMVAPTRHVAA